jgi:hypothetical protein
MSANVPSIRRCRFTTGCVNLLTSQGFQVDVASLPAEHSFADHRSTVGDVVHVSASAAKQ